MERNELAKLITRRLTRDLDTLRTAFASPDRIPSIIIDDLLPDSVAKTIEAAFPPMERLVRNSSLRERKSVGVEMNQYEEACREITYAFQDEQVVNAIKDITSIPGLEGDPRLYAGGLSSMGQGDFLNPHIDNSHDHEIARYRVLNLLYYVTPDWREEYGGNLELWDRGVDEGQRVIASRFNRLVVMATDRNSWHSVSPISHDGRRNCVSNYYFADHPIERDRTYFHVTTFRGRPEQPVRDKVLRVDGMARNGLRKVFRRGLRKTSHVFDPTTPHAD